MRAFTPLLRGSTPLVRGARGARVISARGASLAGGLDDFFHTEPPPGEPPATLVGSTPGLGADAALDLAGVKPGDHIVPPYETTATAGMVEAWATSFHSTNRLITSKTFAQRVGLDDRVLPFDLLCFLAGSMSHADRAVVQVSFSHARYHLPVYVGDTLVKNYRVREVVDLPRSDATDGAPASKATFLCELTNQRGEVVFSADKGMIFPAGIVGAAARAPPGALPARAPDALRDTIVRRAEHLAGPLGGVTLRELRPGQLIVHSACRPLTLTQVMQLSSLARIVHDRHFNLAKHAPSELFVPGGCVLGLVNSASGRELHEVLFQELHHVCYTHPLHPYEPVGALSHVADRQESLSGELEKLEVVTLGVKNVDVAGALAGVPLPSALFTEPAPLRRKRVDAICAEHCPALVGKIVARVERSVYRQAKREDAFLL